MSRIIPMRGITAAAGLLALAAGLLALAPAASAAAAAAQGAAAAAPTWHIVKSVKTGSGSFSAVVATSKTTAWAFDSQFAATAGPTAWQLTGGKWTQDKAFPGKSGESVVASGATSPADVWAFTQVGGGSRVLHYNGKAWAVVKTFSAHIGGASVVAKGDVWVFGTDLFGEPRLGAYYYNGHTWTRTGKNLEGGSALSPASAWAFNGTKVSHWTGTKWIGTQLKALLPPQVELNGPAVTGVIALSATNVYVIGNGNLEDEGGPTVVLHYNGVTWTKVASGNFGYGTMNTGGSQVISTDGKGGLWLPMPGVDGQKSYIVHYAAGKLTAAVLPGSPWAIAVYSISRVPGSQAQLAGGDTYTADNPGTNQSAVILRYSN